MLQDWMTSANVVKIFRPQCQFFITWEAIEPLTVRVFAKRLIRRQLLQFDSLAKNMLIFVFLRHRFLDATLRQVSTTDICF